MCSELVFVFDQNQCSFSIRISVRFQSEYAHAAEHVDLDLLIRPVVLRAQGAALRPLHLAERAFDMVLGAIAAHDVGVAPVVVVGEQQRLAEQGRPQLLPGRLVEGVGERGKIVPLADLDGEEVAHVAGAQPAVDLLGHALDTRGTTALDLPVADQGGDEVAFDGLDGVGGDAVHVVPKALAGELGGFEREQAVEDGALEPGGAGGFGAGVEAAVEDGDEQVGADEGAWAALGDVAVDVVGATEVDLADDFGLAVDALGLAGVVVGVAADDLLDEAGHELSHTLA